MERPPPTALATLRATASLVDQARVTQAQADVYATQVAELQRQTDAKAAVNAKLIEARAAREQVEVLLGQLHQLRQQASASSDADAVANLEALDRQLAAAAAAAESRRAQLQAMQAQAQEVAEHRRRALQELSAQEAEMVARAQAQAQALRAELDAVTRQVAQLRATTAAAPPKANTPLSASDPIPEAADADAQALAMFLRALQ